MATKKNYYYVLVFTSAGAVYVTGRNNLNKVAYWNKDEKPLEMGKAVAEDLVFGLQCNFTNAVMVCHPRPIESQPYNYKYFDCKFVEKEIEA